MYFFDSVWSEPICPHRIKKKMIKSMHLSISSNYSSVHHHISANVTFPPLHPFCFAFTISQRQHPHKLQFLNILYIVFRSTFESDPCAPLITQFDYKIKHVKLECKWISKFFSRLKNTLTSFPFTLVQWHIPATVLQNIQCKQDVSHSSGTKSQKILVGL